MKIALMLFVFSFFMNGVSANEAGFVYQGKKFVVYKDGEKVGKTHEEMFAEKARTPSSKIGKAYVSVLTYEEDELARCYRFTGGSGDNMYCVKK